MANRFDRLLLAKLETTKGTDPTPTPSANAIRCVSFNITPTIPAVDRPAVKQSMGNLPHLIDPDGSCSVEIVAELKGSGTAGTAPDLGPLFLAARTTETIVASTSVTYNPSTATEKSVTLYLYKDGLLWKVTGAVGTFTLNAEQGSALTGAFTLQGKYAAPTAVADPSGASFDSTQPVVFSSADVINDGAVIKVGAIALDAGSNVAEHRVTGDHQFTVTDRAPTLNLTKDSVATAAEWTALTAGTDVSFSATLGATAGNIIAVTAPAARRQTVAYGEREERDTLDVTYGLFESSTDDQFAVKFT